MIDLNEVGKGHRSEAPYLQQLYELVVEINARRVLEIGSGKFTFSQAILKGLEETGGYLHTCDPLVEQTIEHPRLDFMQLKSDLVAETWSEKIDVLMIDGDHDKDQVFRDYYNFAKWVRTPGFVIFHDINIPHGIGVKQLWEHLKKTDKVRLEITSWPGLGVLHV